MKSTFALFKRYFFTLVLKPLKTTQFLAGEGNEH